MTGVAKPHAGALAKTRKATAHPSAARVRPRGREDGSFARNIYAHITTSLGREIVGGVYPPGSLLPSATEICDRFSVSRTALREAYSALSAKGLIVARPKIGTRIRPRAEWNLLDPEVLSWHMVSEPTEHFVAELFVLRQMVEPAAAALAAGSRSPETIDRIAGAYARMERFKSGGGDLIGADLDFHTAILEATENRFLAALGSLIHTALECTFRLSWQGAARIQDNRLHQHRAIFEAIRDGDPDLARARMVELLGDSIDDVRKFVGQRDESLDLFAAPSGNEGP